MQSRLRDEHQAALSAAWHGALWGRIKTFPAHDKAIGMKRANQRQSLKEMAANVRAWRIVLGGEP